ncbi:hypothetical protein GLOIN_2v1685596, partial [Rhizophagus irregularis DAOM 181602=DAOM 197198]
VVDETDETNDNNFGDLYIYIYILENKIRINLFQEKKEIIRVKTKYDYEDFWKKCKNLKRGLRK